MPDDDGTVEAIYAGEVLHAVPRGVAARFLRECRRALAARGTLRVAGIPSADGCAGLEALRSLAAPTGLRIVRSGVQEDGRFAVDLARRLTPPESATPLVSVLIPAYNPRWIRDALASAVAQTYRHIEILVGDDCPTGAVAAIVREFAADRRLTYYRNPHPAGGRANYLGLFYRAAGTYVKFLNDDDLLAPTCIERLLAGLRACPGATLATSHRSIVDAAGQPITQEAWTDALAIEDVLIEGQGLCDLMIAHSANAIGEPTTALFRKADLDGLQPHIFSLDGHEVCDPVDILMWLNLLGRGDAVYLVDRLSSFRVHAAQDQRSASFLQRSRQFWPQVIERGRHMGFFFRETVRPLRRRPLRDLTRRLPDVHVPGPVDHAVSRWIGAVRRSASFPGVDNPPPPEVQALLGRAGRLRAGGSVDGLQAAYDLLGAALARQPERESLRIALADLLLDVDEPAAAREILAGGLGEQPSSAGLYLRLGVAAVQLRRLEEAADAFALARSRVPGAPGPEIGMVAVQMLAGISHRTTAIEPIPLPPKPSAT